MNRNPSINIKLSDFISLCNRLGIPVDHSKALQLFKAATEYTAMNRTVISVDQSRIAEKVIKQVGRASNITNLFNLELYSQRKKLKHSGVRQILKSDPTYPYIEKGAKAAEQFCRDFDLDYDEGVPEFVGIVIKIMGRKFNIRRIVSYADKVYDYYTSLSAVNRDDNKSGTTRFVQMYMSKIGRSESMLLEEAIKDPRELSNFIFARIDCEKNNADYSSWIKAQFDGLEFTGNIPTPSQLQGESARQRYLKWKMNNPEKEVKYRSPENQAYWDWVREKSEKLRQ